MNRVWVITWIGFSLLFLLLGLLWFLQGTGLVVIRRSCASANVSL